MWSILDIDTCQVPLSSCLMFLFLLLGTRLWGSLGKLPCKDFLYVLSELYRHKRVLSLIGETILYCGFSFPFWHLVDQWCHTGASGGGVDQRDMAETGWQLDAHTEKFSVFCLPPPHACCATQKELKNKRRRTVASGLELNAWEHGR